jgi:hypothetical protein
MINHREYRDNPSKWLGTCVEGPHRPVFDSWGKILIRVAIWLAICALVLKSSLYIWG